MGQVVMSFLPPEYWQDFQRITVDVCAFKWPGETVHEYGREGQAQDGVDVHVFDSTTGHHVGIQCKRRRQHDPAGRVLAGGLLSKKEIEEEIKKAEQFTQPLGLFIMATTALTDKTIQNDVIAINAARKRAKQFGVELWFWETYQGHINRHHELMYGYYELVLKSRKEYDLDHHILSVLALSFSRPAFNTRMLDENSAFDMDRAIKDTQTFLSTGKLKDRETGSIIESASGGLRKLKNDKWLQQLLPLAGLLQEARDTYTKAKREGTVVEHGGHITLTDYAVGHTIDRLRREAVQILNTVLKDAGLTPVTSRL